MALNQEDLALPRETGEEKATATCPQCGGGLPVVQSVYGSTAPGACKQCSVSTEGDGQLNAQKAAADAIPESSGDRDSA